MKERGILFSADMVRAILDDRKTQTRRVVVPQPETRRDLFPTESADTADDRASKKLIFALRTGALSTRCLGAENFAREFSPFGQPGERLWVRETWAVHSWRAHLRAGEANKYQEQCEPCIWYRADDHVTGGCYEDQRGDWRPSIHMPRWASRITLDVTAVRAERVQDIGDMDCVAEGLHARGTREGTYFHYDPNALPGKWWSDPVEAYRSLWNSLNEERGYGWDVNPFVWVLEFRRVNAS